MGMACGGNLLAVRACQIPVHVEPTGEPTDEPTDEPTETQGVALGSDSGALTGLGGEAVDREPRRGGLAEAQGSALGNAANQSMNQPIVNRFAVRLEKEISPVIESGFVANLNIGFHCF